MIDSKTRKAALEALTAYAAELRTENERQAATLRRELASVEQFISALAGQEPQGVVRPSVGLPPGLGDKYRGVGPQAAVEQFLKEHPGIQFRPAVLSGQLKAQGFSVPNPKLATQQVAIALGRAVKKGRAVEEQRDGKKSYKFAQGQLALPTQSKDAE